MKKHLSRLKDDTKDRGIADGHITAKDQIICEYLDALENRLNQQKGQISLLKRKGAQSV
jgi:hypothetical protein